MDHKKLIRKYSIQIIFLLGGGLAGFLYWRFVGCSSGTCVIKSVWYYSTLYGLIIGYLAGDMVSGIINKRKAKKSQENGVVS